MMDRCCYPARSENPIMRLIRNAELQNPAPFSDKPLLLLSHEDTNTAFPAAPDSQDVMTDVPITEIVGIYQNTHFLNDKNFCHGKTTFRETLFHHLHGVGLNQACLAYFLSDCKKSSIHDEPYQLFPEDKHVDVLSSTEAKRDIQFVKRRGQYFVYNGQQRVIMAMFFIWQSCGPLGLIKSVRVTLPRGE